MTQAEIAMSSKLARIASAEFSSLLSPPGDAGGTGCSVCERRAALDQAVSVRQ